MTSCPACHEMAFHDNRCSVCGYEEAPVYELPIEAIDGDVEALSLDALEPFAPASQMSNGEALDLGAMEDMEPLVLESSELAEPVPLMEGFEGTMIEERARPRKKEAAKAKKHSTPFVHQICPSCAAPVGQPNPPFCEACGYKLITKRKVAEEQEKTKRCGECGTRNAPDRGICRNCGSRLPSDD